VAVSVKIIHGLARPARTVTSSGLPTGKLGIPHVGKPAPQSATERQQAFTRQSQITSLLPLFCRNPASLRDDPAQVNFQDLGDPQQRVQGWVAQISFDKTYHRLREARALSNHVHGKPAFFTFFAQEPNHV
jgi:hypothetical protein